MDQKQKFIELVAQHDDIERHLSLREGESYLYLQEMQPIELFLREQYQKGNTLSWDYVPMIGEENRFSRLPSTANIQISRHFRYDCSHPHSHNYFQLNYILEGHPVIHYEDESCQTSPGDFFLLAPGIPHWIDSCADDILMLKVYIKYSTFEKTFFRLMEKNNILTSFFRRVLYEGDTRKGYLLFRTNNTAGLREFMLETYRLFLNRVDYLDILMECRITELFCTLIRLYMDMEHIQSADGEPAGVEKVLSYIRKLYNTATLEETASWAGYSKNYLCRLLKKSTGKTYTEILNTVRIEKACQMLLQTGLPATEISGRVGYGTVKHFFRVFREITGMTPQQYRKIYGGTSDE